MSHNLTPINDTFVKEYEWSNINHCCLVDFFFIVICRFQYKEHLKKIIFPELWQNHTNACWDIFLTNKTDQFTVPYAIFSWLFFSIEVER